MIRSSRESRAVGLMVSARDPARSEALPRDLPSDPVRRSRALHSRALHGRGDPARLLGDARELRELGRPDLALGILGRVGSSDLIEEVLFERALCLEAMGRASDALEVVSRLRDLRPPEFPARMLELRALLRAGLAAPDLDYAALAASARDRADLEEMARTVPWARVPIRQLPAILRAARRFGPGRALRLAARALFSKLGRRLSIAVVSVCFRVLATVTGKKHVHVAPLGKFTRLADLVDGVDGLIRGLLRSAGTWDHLVIVLFHAGYPNSQLFRMYRRYCTFLPITNRATLKLSIWARRLLAAAGLLTEITVDYRKVAPAFQSVPAVIAFDRAEASTIARDLAEVGIDTSRPFICMGLRDMAYYRYYGDVMGIPLERQGRRSQTDHRCPPLDAYVRCAEFWAGRGYQVIRMGLRVSQPLPQGLHPLVIDYARLGRSDERDAFLMATCAFLVAGDTGLFSGAAAFDRPSIVTDLFLIRNGIYSSNKTVANIFVPKLIYDERDQRYLTFRELIYFNHFFSYREDCEAAGFRIVHNTAEDVIDASLELTERLAGTYRASREDDERQAAFRAIYVPDHIGYGSTGTVSAAFLRKHSHLLDRS